MKFEIYIWEENQPFSLSVYNEWHSLRIFSFTVTVAESVEFAEALDFILPDIMQLNKEAHSPLCVEDLLPSWIQFLYRMWFGHNLLLCSNISKIIFSNLIFIPNSLFLNWKKIIYCHINDNNIVVEFEENVYRIKPILH